MLAEEPLRYFSWCRVCCSLRVFFRLRSFHSKRVERLEGNRIEDTHWGTTLWRMLFCGTFVPPIPVSVAGWCGRAIYFRMVGYKALLRKSKPPVSIGKGAAKHHRVIPIKYVETGLGTGCEVLAPLLPLLSNTGSPLPSVNMFPVIQDR